MNRSQYNFWLGQRKQMNIMNSDLASVQGRNRSGSQQEDHSALSDFKKGVRNQ